MPLSFPSSPTVGQIYTSGIYSWRWDGERWTPMLVQGASGATGATGATGPAGSNGTIGVDGATGATGPAGVNGATGSTGATGLAAQFFTGNTAPVSPQPGDHWLDTVNMIELVYYADGDSAQWVEITGRASSATTRNLSNLANTAINTSLVPNANLAYDLGTSSLRWRDLYLSGNTIDIGGTAIKSSANGISFTNAANAQATVPLTVSSIQLSTGGNTITLQAGASGLQAVGSSGNAVPIMGGGGGNFTYGNTAPTSPAAGDRWLDSETLKEFVFANLGSTGIWIEPAGDGGIVGATGPAGAAGAAGVNGATGATGIQGNIGVQGATGPAGTAGSQGSTGLTGATGLGFTWRGTWSNLVSYYINDVVSFGGASYVALTLHTGSQPPSANWAVVANQGATGLSGATGLTGATGAAGTAGTPGSAGAQGATGLTGATGPSTAISATDDTTTNATVYPVFVATSGSNQTPKISSSKLTYNASSGLLTVVALTESSSVALKENFSPIDNALTLIEKLQAYTYDRRDGSRYNEPGMIAEEVALVLPNIVTYENNKPTGINYSKLSVYLLVAIKSLKDDIDKLKIAKDN